MLQLMKCYDELWRSSRDKKGKKGKIKLVYYMAIAQKIQCQELVELDQGDLHYSPSFTLFI